MKHTFTIYTFKVLLNVVLFYIVRFLPHKTIPFIFWIWFRFSSLSYFCYISFSRFYSHDPFWHGLATLKYSPLKSGTTGSVVDVSPIPEDSRNTLALVQHPLRPVANVTGFVGPIYTVPEDQKTSGFKVNFKKKQHFLLHRGRIPYKNFTCNFTNENNISFVNCVHSICEIKIS